MLLDKIKKYFGIKELVCKHIYERHGSAAWTFFDPRLLETILFIRENIGRPIYVNNWSRGGNLSQRGLRCNLCQLVKDKTDLDKLYMSAHGQGMGIDFDIDGMSAKQVRNWIKEHQEELPHPIRVEEDVNWVHIDVRSDGKNKLTWFKG